MNAILALLTVIAVIALFLLPTIIVLNNKGKISKIPTILVNILLGWTGIGWIVALIMSTSKDTVAQVVVNNNSGTAPATPTSGNDSPSK